MKLHKSHISTGLMLSLLATFVAGAPTAEAATRLASTEQDVQACVAEIGKRADYDSAARATHWIDNLQQKNLAELSIEIETVIYFGADTSSERRYKTSYVMDLSHKIVEFRMRSIERGDLSLEAA